MSKSEILQASEVLKKLVVHVDKITEAKAGYYSVRKSARVITLQDVLKNIAAD